MSSKEFAICSFKLLFSLLLCLGVAVIASWFSRPDEWYDTLQKPRWTPSNEVFPLVWLPLYVLMGLSLWLVWMQHEGEKSFSSYAWFFLQLIFNFAWPIAFFKLKSLAFALAISVLLLIAIVFTMTTFYRQSRAASYLLVPYFVWVIFATLLNGYLLYNNSPGA